MFMPVTDYKKYIATLKPKDPTADVTSVEMRFGQKSFVAHKGNFAVFTEPSVKEPEALLKQIVASQKSIDAVTAPGDRSRFGDFYDVTGRTQIEEARSRLQR